jgi:hypothetical protein
MLMLGRLRAVGRLRVKSAQFVKTLEPTDSVASMCSINPGRKCSRGGARFTEDRAGFDTRAPVGRHTVGLCRRVG